MPDGTVYCCNKDGLENLEESQYLIDHAQQNPHIENFFRSIQDNLDQKEAVWDKYKSSTNEVTAHSIQRNDNDLTMLEAEEMMEEIVRTLKVHGLWTHHPPQRGQLALNPHAISKENFFKFFDRMTPPVNP